MVNVAPDSQVLPNLGPFNYYAIGHGERGEGREGIISFCIVLGVGGEENMNLYDFCIF